MKQIQVINKYIYSNSTDRTNKTCKEMKQNKIWRIVLMLFMASSMIFSFYSCNGDEPFEDENEIVQPGDSDTNNDQDDDSNDNENDTGSDMTECRYCNGSGDCPGSNCNNGKCIRCDGKGYTYSGNNKITCPWCERGKCPACKGRNECPKCHGRGYM